MPANICTVQWNEIADWVKQLSPSLASIDTIVGVSRSGVPIATTFSYVLNRCRLSFATRSAPSTRRAPFYVFDGTRSERLANTQECMVVSSLPVDANRILIVDDVATFGDTLQVVKDKVIEQNKSATIQFAVFAVDAIRLQQSRPNLFKDVSYKEAIDNQKKWMKFPWQIEKTSERE